MPRFMIQALIFSFRCKLVPNNSQKYQLPATTFHSIDVKPFDYQSTKYVIGIDTEKCLGSGFTGLNTKAGDLMTLKFNKMRTDGYAADNVCDHACRYYYEYSR